MIIPRRFALCVLLMVGMGAIFMIVYSGQIEIADQERYFDAVSSLTDFGDTFIDLTMWERLSQSFSRHQPLPLRDVEVEPLFLYAAVPLYWLAEHLSGVGLVHTTYLFNIFASALICGLFFWYALALGWGEATALIGAVCLGTLTIILPYSQTFFREPLMIVCLLLAALLIERITKNGYRHNIGWIILVLILLVMALRTKDAAILAFPGVVVLMLPDSLWRLRTVKRLVAGFLIVLLVGSVLISFTDVLTLFLAKQTLFGPFTLEPAYSRTALHTYLFSLGGSLWGTSPITLLALPGAWMLWRQGKIRQVFAFSLIILTFPLWYALLRGEEWFGGTIWPQRFLLPSIPFLMMLTLPVIDRWLKSSNRRWLLIFIPLVLYSLWWQFSGLAFRWDEYSRATYDLSFGGLAYWGPGFNDPRYIRPVVLTGLWGQQTLNFAWVRTGHWWIPLVFGGLVVICVWGLRRARQIAVIAPPLFLLAIYITLRAIYIDPSYLGENTALHQMIDTIYVTVPQGEILILNDREYNPFFLNYGKLGKIRVLGFPFHPGDRASCEQELRVESDNPDVLLEPLTVPIIFHVADNYPRLWMLASSGPEIPCVIRPVERFMGQHYYRVSERKTAPTVRLLEYNTTDAPDAYMFHGADTPVNLSFTHDESGERLDLIGVTLPRGDICAAGDWMPISLYWRTEQELTQVYTVAWFVADASGVKAQGEDSWHGATFTPTTLWRPGVPVWDHRALRLPADLPPGDYQFWVKVYLQDVVAGTITDLTASGDTILDGNIGVLPVTCSVSDGDSAPPES